MKPRHWVCLIAGLLMVLAPVTARAEDGTIQDLSFDPDPGTEGQTVNITVLGTGKCKKVSINFGDISPPVVLENLDFDNTSTDDNSTTHVYDAAGSYTVTAATVQQCLGGAQKSLTVEVSTALKAEAWEARDYLCDILENCDGNKMVAARDKNPQLTALPPNLGGIFPFSVIEPGGDVIVTGQNFGKTKGELHLFLKTDQKDIKLTVDTWDNQGIGARIPFATTGVVDQPAEFYVKAAGGESNRSAPVDFTARRILRTLPRSDVQFDDCSCEATCNTCAAATQRANCPHDCFTTVSDSGTLSGFHYAACGIGTDSDRDTFDVAVNFKNGWELDDATIFNQVPPGEGNATVSLDKGAGKIKVDWSVTQCDTLLYTVWVFIKGPLGTDYK